MTMIISLIITIAKTLNFHIGNIGGRMKPKRGIGRRRVGRTFLRQGVARVEGRINMKRDKVTSHKNPGGETLTQHCISLYASVFLSSAEHFFPRHMKSEKFLVFCLCLMSGKLNFCAEDDDDGGGGGGGGGNGGGD